MKNQKFEIVQLDKPRARRHHFAVKINFPHKTETIGTIQWDYDHAGYVFSVMSFPFIALNTLRAICQLIDDLMNDRPNQYVTKNDF